ncbi:MAG: patatin-like phospholipase family protein [Pseudomonadota bacterium]
MRRILWPLYLLISAAALLLFGLLAFAFVYSNYFATYDASLPAYGAQPSAGSMSWSTDDPDRIRILSIDGGGMFGIAELEVLKGIEDKAGRPIHELFDFVAGSSTGAIAASLLLLPDAKTGKPKSAEEAIDTYRILASKVLERPVSHRLQTAFGLFGPVFDNRGHVAAAQEAFGDAVFGDLLRPAMMPGFTRNDNSMRFFRNWEPDNQTLLLSSLVTAVTSAETIFPSTQLVGLDGADAIVSDPGFVLSSPAHAAYVLAREAQTEVKEIIVVSVSNDFPPLIDDNIQLRGGMVQWFFPLSVMVFRGERSLVQQALKAHGSYDSEVSVTYFELVPFIEDAWPFSASAENIDKIKQAGADYVSKHQNLLGNVVAALEKPTSD